MSVWDDLTTEQYSVMIIALEEAYLNGVIYEYNFRAHSAQTAIRVVAPPISEVAVRSSLNLHGAEVSG